MKIRTQYFDSDKITGTMQRFKTSYLQGALKEALDDNRSRCEIETRTLEDNDKKLREIQKKLRLKQRELTPLLEGVENKARAERPEKLRSKIRMREAAARGIQSLLRGHRVRKAIERSGGINYWVEGFDESTGRVYFHNTWTGDTTWRKPLELELFGGKDEGRTAPTDSSNWTMGTDETTNLPFYFNVKTKEYRWEKPDDFDGVPGEAAFMSSATDGEWFLHEQAQLGQKPLVTARSEAKRQAGDWKEMVDEESGHKYYLNEASGDWQWEMPEGFNAEWTDMQDLGALNARSDQKRNVGDWQERTDQDSGALYYYNVMTEEVQWEKPANFDNAWLAGEDLQKLTARSTVKRELGQWKELWDPDAQQVYYFNEATNESAWEKPQGWDDQQWLDSQDTAQLTDRSKKTKEAGAWSELVDETSGATYYFNSDTHETQWEPPPGFAVAARMQVMSARSSKRRETPRWQELYDDVTGAVYYYCASTDEYSYTKPAGFDEQWLEAQDSGRLTERSTAQKKIGGEGWIEMWDEESQAAYYMNEKTGETSWSLPPKVAHQMEVPPSARGGGIRGRGAAQAQGAAAGEVDGGDAWLAAQNQSQLTARSSAKRESDEWTEECKSFPLFTLCRTVNSQLIPHLQWIRRAGTPTTCTSKLERVFGKCRRTLRARPRSGWRQTCRS